MADTENSSTDAAIDALTGFTVRRLTPEDAAGVVACVRAVYGESYVHPELYDPTELIRLNAREELVSVVALDEAGVVVGHYALERPGLARIAEEGEAMVLPARRHQHLMEAMRKALEDEAHRLNLIGLYGQAVTNHLYSQKVQLHYGLTPCAILLGSLPRSFHNMAQPLPQRGSSLIGFKYLRSPEGAALEVSKRHEALCASIYQALRLPLEFLAPTKATAAGSIDSEWEPSLAAGAIRVRRIGQDTLSQIRAAMDSMAREGRVEAMTLDIPGNQAGAADLGDAVAELGFFFSGVGPHFADDGDTLRYQFLAETLDVALVQIESSLGRQLLAHVDAERQRVKR
jgi:serine/threonine-protein kinase RsbW